MLIDIVEAAVVAGYRVRLRFADGVTGELDLSEIIRFEGMFESLRDAATFASLTVSPDLGTICWPNGADLDPDVLYARITRREISLPVRIVGPWTVEVGPGAVCLGARVITLSQAVKLTVNPTSIVQVRDEIYKALPVSTGARLERLITAECTAPGLLFPESVRIKPMPNNVAPFVVGKDYALDSFWGTLGRLETGDIAADQAVYVDYDYAPCRLDSIVADPEGHVELISGKPGMGSIYPVEPGVDKVALANIWIPGRTEKLGDDNVYPIEFIPPGAKAQGPCVAEALLPKTLGKLKDGKDVTIVAWGDSVTGGGGVDRYEEYYQVRFVSLLKDRFPNANIILRTAAWPGGNSRGYLEAPKGGTYDFARDVLDPKPDLVTVEFVNDAYLDEEATQAQYRTILERLRGNGAEVVLITPHFVRPDWMNVQTMKLDEDPRPYVKGLRRFASENNVALADASKSWCGLWLAGIPYITLETNSINHPDARGHEIFAQALFCLFE